MKKMILSLIAMVLAAPVMATEPSDLNGLGLAGFRVVSEDAGMEVRGLGAVASSSGLSTLRLFVIDPTTGSTFNANASNFSVSSEESTLAAPVAAGEEVLANSGSFAALTGLAVDINGFTFSVDGSAGSGGQGSSALAQDSAFTFTAGSFTFAN